MEPKILESVTIDNSMDQKRTLALAVVILAFLLIVSSGLAVYEYSRAQEQTRIAASEHQRADAQAAQVAMLQRHIEVLQRDNADLRAKASTGTPLGALKHFFSGARNLLNR